MPLASAPNGDLIEQLKMIQLGHMWDDETMGSHLDLKRSSWCMVKNGHHRLGIRALGLVVENWPELAALVAFYVRESARLLRAADRARDKAAA